MLESLAISIEPASRVLVAETTYKLKQPAYISILVVKPRIRGSHLHPRVAAHFSILSNKTSPEGVTYTLEWPFISA